MLHLVISVKELLVGRVVVVDWLSISSIRAVGMGGDGHGVGNSWVDGVMGGIDGVLLLLGGLVVLLITVVVRGIGVVSSIIVGVLVFLGGLVVLVAIVVSISLVRGGMVRSMGTVWVAVVCVLFLSLVVIIVVVDSGVGGNNRSGVSVMSSVVIGVLILFLSFVIIIVVVAAIRIVTMGLGLDRGDSFVASSGGLGSDWGSVSVMGASIVVLSLFGFVIIVVVGGGVSGNDWGTDDSVMRGVAIVVLIISLVLGLLILGLVGVGWDSDMRDNWVMREDSDVVSDNIVITSNSAFAIEISVDGHANGVLVRSSLGGDVTRRISMVESLVMSSSNTWGVVNIAVDVVRSIKSGVSVLTTITWVSGMAVRSILVTIAHAVVAVLLLSRGGSNDSGENESSHPWIDMS